MIPYSVVQSYSTLRGRIADSALVELRSILSGVSHESPAVQREALHDLIPMLGDQYVDATSMVAATFFDELMELQEVRRPVAPELVPLQDRKRWRALVDWSAGDYVFQHLGPNMVYSRIAGGVTRTLTESAADTMIGNAGLQGSALFAQRVPKPGCCAFCSMLASRGAVYSADSASRVVGRGQPVGSHRRAKGIKPRGAQALGEKFHDYCRCEVVTLTPDNEVELQAEADKHLEAYEKASANQDAGRELQWREVTLKDGTTRRKHYWTKGGETHTAADKTSDIVAAMRADLGVK